MKTGKGLMKAAAFFAAAVMAAGIPFGSGTGFFSAAPLTAYAEETPESKENSSFYYEKYSDHIVISFPKSRTDSTLTIPSTIDGLPVTEIGIYAFQTCEFTSVTLPDTLKVIGKYSFGFCKNLTSITLPDSLEFIDLKAFEDCTSLREVNFPDKMVMTGEFSFLNTPWLDAQRQKDPMVIVNGALVDGQTLTGEVKIPSTVQYIAGSAFSGNEKITSIVVPSSVKQIKEGTFYRCSNLTSAELNGCTSIGHYAFGACNKLTDLKISGKLQNIELYGFVDNTATATITFYGSQSAWDQVEKPSDDAFLQRARMVFDESHQPEEEVIGDINKDGKCDAADAVLLQKWLIAEQGVVLADWKAGDMNKDNKLDARDLTLLKRTILS
ncbi:MAG: leucine-rich repeat protein [Oscillospiraceae bacterium]|nr:leucine-rich repeat protein [Oscillospiraceae bacterium]